MSMLTRWIPMFNAWICILLHECTIFRCMRIQLLDSRPGRKKTMLSGVQQNLEVSPYDLRTFNFITPMYPSKLMSEHDCGVFVMKFMELWSMGGFSKSIDVVREIETLQVENHGEYVVLGTKCTPRPCPERLKGL
ncbi:hypothetical protein AAG906_037529 [Vitis piasezkii]